VGFDNSPVEALEHPLTRLDCNASGFIHRMVNSVVRPPHPRGAYRHSAIEIDAIVVQRDTTPPKSKNPDANAEVLATN
jgi:hypothetical protein